MCLVKTFEPVTSRSEYKYINHYANDTRHQLALNHLSDIWDTKIFGIFLTTIPGTFHLPNEN